jgi:acyl-CoA thioester hydrolase
MAVRSHRPYECDVVCRQVRRGDLHLFAQIGLTPSYLRDNGRGMAAVQQNISYKRELIAGDIVEVRSRVLELRERVLRFRA